MSLLQNSNAIEAGGYPIQNSLRFQSASSQYLSRTPASAGNRQTWTWSGWVKRGSPTGQIQAIFGAQNGAQADQLMFDSNDKIAFYSDAWTVGFPRVSSAVYRDYAAWYHIVCVADTTNATAQNRLRIYVNGSEITAWSTNTTITQNAQGFIDNNVQHMFGRNPASAGQWLDGYMAEINFIDGQALTPSSFGETNALTGQWVAKEYTGTYGTNGFYLPFSNGTSTTTLGADSSGNGNNWTLTNFTRSAGTSDCWMKDVPSGNSGVSATQPSSNYCVLNPLWKGSGITVSNSNQTITSTSSGLTLQQSPATMAMSGGKFYWEVNIATAASPTATLGVALTTALPSSGIGRDANSWGYNPNGGGSSVLWYNGSSTNVAVDSNTGTFGVAFDADAGKLWFRNAAGNWISGDPAAGTSPSFSSVTAGVLPTIGQSSGGGTTVVSHLNCGQRSFVYTPPSGFKALCTANLPTSSIVKGNQYMDATLYTGTAATLSVTNAGSFSPDLVWLKQRNAGSTNHYWFDSVRGVFNYLFSDGTNAEASASNTLTAFNSNGFTLGSSTGPNPSGGSMVAWQWDAGTTTVTNTNGTISSQVRANPTAGVSVVTYTGTGANATVGHGLGVAPKMVIVKWRSAVGSWIVWFTGFTASEYLLLNATDAKGTIANYWNGTPTSSVINLSSQAGINSNGGTYVAYCFAEIAGFSKFGSYNANGNADGPFNYTGFRPKFVMIKRTDSAESWIIEDSSRTPYNGMQAWLYPNLANAEGSGSSAKIDFLSNGFKLRNSADGGNISGGTYIYMAFAESPFANSNSR